MSRPSSDHPFLTQYRPTSAGFDRRATPPDLISDASPLLAAMQTARTVPSPFITTPPSTPRGPVSPRRAASSPANKPIPAFVAEPVLPMSPISLGSGSESGYSSPSAYTASIKRARRETVCFGPGGNIGFGPSFESFPSAADEERYLDTESTVYTATTEDDDYEDEDGPTEAQLYAAAARLRVPRHHQSVEEIEVEIEDIYAGYFAISREDLEGMEEGMEVEEEEVGEVEVVVAAKRGNRPKVKFVIPSPIPRSDTAYDARQHDEVPRCSLFRVRRRAKPVEETVAEHEVMVRELRRAGFI